MFREPDTCDLTPQLPEANVMTQILSHRATRTLVFILASSLASFASVIGTFDRSFQVNGPVDLEVLTRSGDVTVRNGSTGTVSIHAKIHSSNSWFGGDHKAEVQELQNNPPVRQNGNSIRIDYVNLNEHFCRLRNHRPGEHRNSFSHRQRRPDDRRSQRQHRSRKWFG